MFRTFSGLDYLKIDIANACGKDKLNFEDRIKWFNENIPETVITMNNIELTQFCKSFNPEDIDSIELLFTGLKAYKDTWFHKPSGYMCQLDAVCSGSSLMSCLTADKQGLMNTGLLGNNRADLYSAVYNTMKELYRLPMSYTRSDIKQAVMTFLYGSKAEPKKIFNNDKNIINCFYQAVQNECGGAYELQEILIDTWNPNTTSHHWVMPDGFEVHIPVIVEREFEHTFKDGEETYTIPYHLKVEGTKKKSVSNCANVIHSTDGMLVREMVRRCMFDIEHTQEVLWYLVNTKDELYEPLCIDDLDNLGKLGELIYYYEQSKFCSIRIIDEIKSQADTYKLSKEHRNKLIDILSKMLQHKTIEVICVHDCYKCHPNNMNYIRYWYKEMCADIVESNMLVYLTNQLLPVDVFTGDPVDKSLRKRIASEVRKSNYGLC